LLNLVIAVAVVAEAKRQAVRLARLVSKWRQKKYKKAKTKSLGFFIDTTREA